MILLRNYALVFKALGNDVRIKILELLSDKELCACEILKDLNITQPTLSHHMKILSEVNLVSFESRGKWTYYQLNQDTVSEIIDLFSKKLKGKVLDKEENENETN